MIATMAKKKPEPARPANRHRGKPLAAWVSDELKEALRRQAHRERRSVSKMMILLLEEALAARGFWPPSESEHSNS